MGRARPCEQEGKARVARARAPTHHGHAHGRRRSRAAPARDVRAARVGEQVGVGPRAGLPDQGRHAGRGGRARADALLHHAGRDARQLPSHRGEQDDRPAAVGQAAAHVAALYARRRPRASASATRRPARAAERPHAPQRALARTGAAINGTLVSTLAGTASVPLLSLFGTSDAARSSQGAKGKAARPRGLHADPAPVPQLGRRSTRRSGVCVAADRPRGPTARRPRCRRSSSRRPRRRRASRRCSRSSSRIYDGAWEMTKHAKFRARAQPAQERRGRSATRASTRAGTRSPRPSTTRRRALRPEVAEAVLAAALAQELPGEHAKCSTR